MNTNTRDDIVRHMLDVGLSMLGRAVCDATFTKLGTRYGNSMAVTMAANSAEILVKAKIAEEHPLLIFERLPKIAHAEGKSLGLRELARYARSTTYADLPERLWATTSLRIPRTETFLEFGRLRNQVVHLGWATPGAGPVLEFAFEVVEPMLIEHWGESVLPSARAWDDVILEGYLQSALAEHGVVPPDETAAQMRAELERLGTLSEYEDKAIWLAIPRSV